MAWKCSAKCATLDRLWYSGNMITIIPIEPLSDAHGALIVETFNMLFIDRGGRPDGEGVGLVYLRDGGGFGDGYGFVADCCRYGDGCGDGWDNGSVNVPEEWRSE